MMEALTARPSASTSASTSAATPVVLDAQALARLNKLDPSGSGQLFVRVMSTYRKSLARLSGELAAARQPFDPDSMRMAAHTLKSSSASVGALGLAQLCGSAETALREGRFESLPAILDALLAQARQVELAVHQLLLPT